MYKVTVTPTDNDPKVTARLKRHTIEINGTIVGYGWKEECDSLAEEITGNDEKCKAILEAMGEII